MGSLFFRCHQFSSIYVSAYPFVCWYNSLVSLLSVSIMYLGIAKKENLMVYIMLYNEDNPLFAPVNFIDFILGLGHFYFVS